VLKLAKFAKNLRDNDKKGTRKFDLQISNGEARQVINEITAYYI
jgi:hypothetical protein